MRNMKPLIITITSLMYGTALSHIPPNPPLHGIMSVPTMPKEAMYPHSVQYVNTASSSNIEYTFQKMENFLMGDDGGGIEGFFPFNEMMTIPQKNMVTGSPMLQKRLRSPERYHCGRNRIEEALKDVMQPPEESPLQLSLDALFEYDNIDVDLKDPHQNYRTNTLELLRGKTKDLPVHSQGISKPVGGIEHHKNPSETFRQQRSSNSYKAPIMYQGEKGACAINGPEVAQDNSQTSGLLGGNAYKYDSCQNLPPPVGFNEKLYSFPEHPFPGTSKASNRSPKDKHCLESGNKNLSKLVRTLHSQGVVEMGVSDRIPSDLFSLFKVIHENIFNLGSNKTPPPLDLLTTIESGLKRTKSFSMKFFGGLGIIHQLNAGKFSKLDLLLQGCVFLMSFFEELKSITLEEVKEWVSIRHMFNTKHPVTALQLLKYLMSVNDRTEVSYASVLTLIISFSEWKNSQDKLLVLNYDVEGFTNKCWDIHRKQNEIARFNFPEIECHVTTGLGEPTLEDESRLHIFSRTRDSLIQVKKRKSSDTKYTITKGKSILSLCNRFKVPMDGFFNTLKLNLLERSQELDTKGLQGLWEHHKSPAKPMMRFREDRLIEAGVEDLCNHLILSARIFLTPMFLEIVKAYSNHKRHFANVDSSLEDGWEFLKRYFLTWPEMLGLPKCSQAYKRASPDWFNTQHVLIVLLGKPTSTPPPIGLVKYLFAQWATNS